MFFPINDTMINPRMVERIEWLKERFVVYFGNNALPFPMQFAGQANDLAAKFIRTHNGTLVNPDNIQYAYKYPSNYVVYMEHSYHTIVEQPEIEKLNAIMKRRGK